MKKLRKLASILVGIAVVGMCFAPIEGKPEDQKFHPELSESQLQQLQGGGVAAPSGQSSFAPELGSGASLPNSNSNAADMLAKSGSNGGSGSAELSLKQADDDQKVPAPKPGANLMFAGLFIIIGLALVVGIRAYLDKAVPEMPTKKR